MVKPTSIEAYRKLLPNLSDLCTRVLGYLIKYMDEGRTPPTANELGFYMKQSGVEDPYNDAHKRLPDLANTWNAVHQGKTRVCTRSKLNNTAITWILGPPPGQAIGKESYTLARFYVLWEDGTWLEYAIHVDSEPGQQKLEEEVRRVLPMAYPETSGRAIRDIHLCMHKKVPRPEAGSVESNAY
ncbi:hypothetical protein LCGC14_0163100 [marine sediment metagenome]|uniref:Uncharacterized protein n=1 Tax=marine sediment metagenome TaxID=412755 RepID=A0A0F9XCD8_9ZZZZ